MQGMQQHILTHIQVLQGVEGTSFPHAEVELPLYARPQEHPC